ncbi:MAG: YgjV family protein [Clostridia bacterium]|nr:YgjV family protein [Clostridia bacterium]
MIHRELIGEVIGFVAAVTGFFIFQQKKRKNILRVKFICDILWTAHFLFLGAYSGMAISAVGCTRDMIFYKKGEEQKRNKAWLFVFLTVNIISVFLSWKSIWSICSLISGILATIAFWNRYPMRIKIFSFIVCISQMTYGIAIGSYAVMLNETIAITSILVFFIRYFKSKKGEVKCQRS